MSRAEVQTALNNLTTFLKTTKCLGSEMNNPIDRIEVVEYEYGERYARPIFKDGAGSQTHEWKDGRQHGYYDVCITADSPDAACLDVWNHFVTQFM